MVAPGWYNDEADPSVARWHDGTGWTAHTMRKADWAGPGSPPPPAALAAPDPSPQPPPEPPWIEAPPQVSRSARSGWERPSGYLLAAITSLVVILVCLLVLQSLHDRRERETAGGTATSTTLASYSSEWTTKEGGTYRVTVTPSAAPIDQPSPSGCIAAPTKGHTNLEFDIKVENLSPDQEAPVPQISFGLNLDGAGQLDPAITTLDKAVTDVEIGPVAAGSSCSQARSILPESRDPIPPGGSLELTGVAGGAPFPIPNGLGVIVRVFQADPAQVARGTGFSPVDTLAPFPFEATTSSS
jgi:hypothetical protein